MSERKERVTVTLDRQLIKAANAAVAAGRAGSLSAWVNVALADHVAKEQRLLALGRLVADYEAEHGEISDAVLARREREDRRNAVVTRGAAKVATRKRRSRAA